MEQNQKNDGQDVYTCWRKDEMVALIDIFKNIVNAEIENKQATKATLNS